MGCGVYWSQIHQIEDTLASLRRFGMPDTMPAISALQGLRGKLMAQVGFKFPRSIVQILAIAGLSPGSLTLFEDVEAGWLVLARSSPGAPPVYHYVDDSVAERIVKGTIDHALEARLMTPDDYIGE